MNTEKTLQCAQGAATALGQQPCLLNAALDAGQKLLYAQDAAEALSDQPYLLHMSDTRMPLVLKQLMQACPHLGSFKESFVLVLSFLGTQDDAQRYDDAALCREFARVTNEMIERIFAAALKAGFGNVMEIDETLGRHVVEVLMLPENHPTLDCARELLNSLPRTGVLRVVTLTAHHFGALANIRASVLE